MSKKLSRELIAQKVKSDRIESIRNLNLWGSNIEDISIIEEMPSLEIVSLSVNKIRTLRPFSNLTNLRELYLRRNLITNLNEIKYLTDCQNLNVLWLSENPICDNPNYRAVVICVLPQLQKLDDIAITDEEREKAEKRLSGNFEEDNDDEEEDQNIQEEENNNKNFDNMRQQQIQQERYSPKKNTNNYENEDNKYYGKNNNNMRKSQNQNQRNKNNKQYDERQDDEEDYIKPKKTFQPNRYKQNDEYEKYNNNDDMYNYDNRPIRANSGMVPKNNNFKKNNNYRNYEDNYEYNNNSEKKKGNSNILNCVISLLKELSPNELQIVKREIDRLNY